MFEEEKLIILGNVIVDSISCLPVLDPLTNENAGRSPGLFTRAQHAITVPLPITETALVHLTAGIPGQSAQGHEHNHTQGTALYMFMCREMH